MSIATVRYVRKPLYVEAVQITEENFCEVALWCQGEIRNPSEDRIDPELVQQGIAAQLSPKNLHIQVRVHSPKTPRHTRAYVGDWMLYTEMGYKIYTEKAFEMAFDIAETYGEVEAVKRQVG